MPSFDLHKNSESDFLGNLWFQNCLNAKHMMMKQKTAINQLEGEMNEIETEMKLASSCKNRKQDNENSEDLQSFMKGQDEYATKIAKEAEEIQCKFFFQKQEKRDKTVLTG